jgi:hypothetical protein
MARDSARAEMGYGAGQVEGPDAAWWIGWARSDGAGWGGDSGQGFLVAGGGAAAFLACSMAWELDGLTARSGSLRVTGISATIKLSG